MPSLAVCRCPFRLMRRCFLGRWICLLVSERFCLVWKCSLFGYNTYIQFCVHWHGSQCQRRLVPNYAVVFQLGYLYSPVTLCHRKSLTAITQKCYEQYRTSPGGSTSQSSSYTTTYHPSRKIIKVRQTRHTGHFWRSRDELISDILLWTPSHGRAKAGQLAWAYIQRLCADTGYSLEDLPGTMADREGWWERVRAIRAGGTTWWW